MVSVIIVAYNAEKYIARSIASVLNQTYKDFELIIINDGSTDNTLDVINDFAKEDSRIIVKSRENLGVAKSRQEGLDLSKGDYTIFVDADDWVERDFLECLLKEALQSNADMVICDIFVEQRETTEYSEQRPQIMDAGVILGQILKDLYGSLWNKLINRTIFEKYGVRFLDGLNCCEDQYVVIALLSHGISVSYCNRALYHYDKTININSITNKWLDYDVSKRILFVKSIQPFINTSYQLQCYDDYIGRLAYTATAASKEACPNYRKLFEEFKPYIKRSHIPYFKKIVCFLRLNGIVVPTRIIKTIRLYFRNKRNNQKNA